MQSFTDRNGTVRTIDLHIIKLEQISTALGIKVHDIQELSTIGDNTLKQCELLWLSSDASEPFEEFAQSLTLQSIEDGMDAFIVELCRVLPVRHSAVLQASHTRAKTLRSQLTAKALEFLQQPA